MPADSLDIALGRITVVASPCSQTTPAASSSAHPPQSQRGDVLFGDAAFDRRGAGPHHRDTAPDPRSAALLGSLANTNRTQVRYTAGTVGIAGTDPVFLFLDGRYKDSWTNFVPRR